VTLLRGKKGPTAPLSKVIVLTLAAYLLLSMDMDGKVLCLGENGHVAVESVGGACCDHDVPDTLRAHDGDDHDGCVDVPLLSAWEHTVSGRKITLNRHTPAPHQAIIASDCMISHASCANLPLDCRNKPWFRMELQRSVVLLL